MNVRNHSSVQQTPLRKDSIVVASGLVRNPHLVPLRVVEYQLPKFPIKDRFQSELNKDCSHTVLSSGEYTNWGSEVPNKRQNETRRVKSAVHSNIRVSGRVPRWFLNQ